MIFKHATVWIGRQKSIRKLLKSLKKSVQFDFNFKKLYWLKNNTIFIAKADNTKNNIKNYYLQVKTEQRNDRECGKCCL